MVNQKSLLRFAALGIVAGLLAMLVPDVGAQAVKRGDSAKRFPKVGIYTFTGTENFPIEVGQKIFTDGDATLQSVAPELVGLSAARFPRGGTPTLGTTAPVQLLIGYFRGEGAEFAKPPEGQKPVIENAMRISGMPPVDIYLQRFNKSNVKTGVPVEMHGVCAMLGVVPVDFKITPWDAKGGEAK